MDISLDLDRENDYKVDLHTHTNYSDGGMSVKGVVEKAAQNGVDILSITDHDSLDGISEAKRIASKYNIKVISGVELTSYYNWKKIDILGYGFDEEDFDLNKLCKNLTEYREKRAFGMIQDLNKKTKLSIEYSKLIKRVRENFDKLSVVGRSHIADYLVECYDRFVDADAVFDEYLKPWTPWYKPKSSMKISQSIESIKKANWKAVLAHPGRIKDDRLVEEILDKYDFDGIEVYYPLHDVAQVYKYLDMASKYGLFVTGGSDFHGDGDRDVLWVWNYSLENIDIDKL